MTKEIGNKQLRWAAFAVVGLFSVGSTPGSCGGVVENYCEMLSESACKAKDACEPIYGRGGTGADGAPETEYACPGACAACAGKAARPVPLEAAQGGVPRLPRQGFT